MVVLILALALPCWALAARNRTLGWQIAGVLLALLLAQTALALHWVFSGARVTLLVLLTLATAATLLIGVTAHSRSPVGHRRRSTGRRGLVGLVLCWVYCAVIALGAAGVAVLYGINGLPPQTPSSSDILPLPSGLTITADMDDGCSGGSTTLCLREIDVAGANGQDQATIISELDALVVARGWQSGTSCRNVGVLLDRHNECVSVGLTRSEPSVQLQDSSGW